MGKRAANVGMDPGDDVGEIYRISYTSLIILLLAFFIFLVSLTTADAIKSANLRESLDKKFTPAELAEAEDLRQISALALQYGFTVKKAADHMLITLPGSGVFESGSDVIKPEMLPALVGIAGVVRKQNLSSIIEGHTDNRPIFSERFPSNWELSAARATSVLRLFLEQGVASDKLAAAGRGEYVPVASNDAEEGRAQNRRVTLQLKSSLLPAAS